MFNACGKNYYEIGDKVNQNAFVGAPKATIVECLYSLRGDGDYFYRLAVDVSNHPEGFDENGERVSVMTCLMHESELDARNIGMTAREII